MQSQIKPSYDGASNEDQMVPYEISLSLLSPLASLRWQQDTMGMGGQTSCIQSSQQHKLNLKCSPTLLEIKILQVIFHEKKHTAVTNSGKHFQRIGLTKEVRFADGTSQN